MAWAIGSLKEGFLVKSSFVALREDDSLSSRVSKLTGIIADELEDAPTLGEVLYEIKEDIENSLIKNLLKLLFIMHSLRGLFLKISI